MRLEILEWFRLLFKTNGDESSLLIIDRNEMFAKVVGLVKNGKK